jgi:hypothetical protein
MATLIVTPLALAWRVAGEAAAVLPKSTNDAATADAVALNAVLCIHFLLLIVPLPWVLSCSFADLHACGRTHSEALRNASVNGVVQRHDFLD